MAMMKKKGASTLGETLELTDNEGEHVAALKTEKQANMFFDALSAYRKRVMTLVFNPAHKGKPERESDTIERIFHKVLREAGEVGAVTYVRLMFTDVTLAESFFNEVAECFVDHDSPKAARKEMYRTKAWKREVKVTQTLVQYPLHK